MRIVKCEKIFLSQNEADVWANFNLILEGLERGSESPDIGNLVCKILSLLDKLWEEIEDIE
ncbi:hypothetical protein IJD44_00845 [bacterium]|nr:hypothetical protein [bacterium]